MPIVSHKLESTTEIDGVTHNVLRMYDQDGIEYMCDFFAPPGLDVNNVINIRISAMDEQLAEAEFEQIIGGE